MRAAIQIDRTTNGRTPEMAARNLSRPTKALTEKDRKIGETIKDATAPIGVNDALTKLCRKYGTDRVLAQVREWVAFIERSTDG